MLSGPPSNLIQQSQDTRRFQYGSYRRVYILLDLFPIFSRNYLLPERATANLFGFAHSSPTLFAKEFSAAKVRWRIRPVSTSFGSTTPQMSETRSKKKKKSLEKTNPEIREQKTTRTKRDCESVRLCVVKVMLHRD